MTSIREICDAMKAMAPLHLVEDWDNVGLLAGDADAECGRVITCLTLTHDVADEAIEAGARLVITHHPILFKPLKKITSENVEGRLLLKLFRHEVAVYSPHTAWDNAATGINQQLADLLQLRDVTPLRAQVTKDACKIVTFVPDGDLDQVRRSLWEAGAGTIGDYVNCSFVSRGTGTFYGTESTNPAVGEAGRLEQVDEARLEVVCDTKLVAKALQVLRNAHPYEEPAIDVFSIKAVSDEGTGRMGTLPQAVTLEQLSAMVGTRLNQPYMQFVGDARQIIGKLGIACGAAGEYLRDAQRNGCDAFLTGEARFHSCLEARDGRIGLILPGHYATERFAMQNLAIRLCEQLPGIRVTASQSERDPVCFLNVDAVESKD